MVFNPKLRQGRADEIRQLRERKGLTQEQAARLFGVTLQTVSRWERAVFDVADVKLDGIKAKLAILPDKRKRRKAGAA